jgi:hypothetical protein
LLQGGRTENFIPLRNSWLIILFTGIFTDEYLVLYITDTAVKDWQDGEQAFTGQGRPAPLKNCAALQGNSLLAHPGRLVTKGNTCSLQQKCQRH